MSEIIVGAHFYDPPRSTYHEEFQDVITDPKGDNWLKIVYERAYLPIMNSGVLNHISYDINQVLLHEMKRNGLECGEYTKGKKDNVIGTSYIHPILPDLSQDDKRIVIGAGVESYRRDFNRDPKIFWPPEAAMDDATAQVLVEFGYQAFVCAPWQVEAYDGIPSDNRPMQIKLEKGNSIIAIPYDRELSNELAHGENLNADHFRDKHITKKSDNPMLITWTDGETYGHWKSFGELFLQYLLTHSLPEIRIKPTPINQIDFTRMKLPQGRLINRRAWSCHCGDLARWNRGCGCSEGSDASWKPGFYDLFSWLNTSITSIVAPNLGKEYVHKMITNFEPGFINPGGKYTNPEQSLIAAKVDSLTSRTSCGTFHKDPHAAGRINIVFGLEAIQHLRDAGLSNPAEKLELEFMSRLQKIRDPKDYNRTMADVTHNMLQKRIATQYAYSFLANQ